MVSALREIAARDYDNPNGLQYIISTFITPYYFKNVIAYAIETGKTSPEEAETFFNLQSYIIQSVVSSLTFGLVLSALVALAVKRK